MKNTLRQRSRLEDIKHHVWLEGWSRWWYDDVMKYLENLIDHGEIGETSQVIAAWHDTSKNFIQWLIDTKKIKEKIEQAF